MGQDLTAPGGVYDGGTHEEEDPATWETLTCPGPQPVPRSPGDHAPTRRTSRTPVRPASLLRGGVAQNQGVRSEEGRRRGEPEPGTDAGQGVGGPHTSDDVGERQAAGPGRAKAARVDANFRREP